MRQREVATELTFLIGATGAGGAKRLEQGEQSDYSRGSGATTVGGAERLQYLSTAITDNRKRSRLVAIFFF
jgi:hypothetical protein